MKNSFLKKVNKSEKKNQKGMSVIELLIAMVIFMVVMTSVYGILKIGNMSRTTINNRSENIKNVRMAINTIGREAVNAGLGYNRIGGTVPDDFTTDNFRLPPDQDKELDLLTAISAGYNISESDLSQNGQKNDVVAFAFRDFQFNDGFPIVINDVTEKDGKLILKTPAGACANCRPYDLFLIETGEGKQAIILSTDVVNNNQIVLGGGKDDPLKINYEDGTTGGGGGGGGNNDKALEEAQKKVDEAQKKVNEQQQKLSAAILTNDPNKIADETKKLNEEKAKLAEEQAALTVLLNGGSEEIAKDAKEAQKDVNDAQKRVNDVQEDLDEAILKNDLKKIADETKKLNEELAKLNLAKTELNGIMSAYGGSNSNTGSAVKKCKIGETKNCINYSSTTVVAKKIYLVSYSVAADGTLIRTTYGNNTGGSAEEQISRQPIANGVRSFKLKYLLSDGTVTEDPSVANTQKEKCNEIVQIEVTATVEPEAGGAGNSSDLIVLSSTFSTRNLKYDVY